MKQFNLVEYLANPSRKIVTRNGRNVRIICTDKRGTKFPIVALVEYENGEEIYYYTPKGCWNLYEEESDIDLFFAPKKTEGWINIYSDSSTGHNIYDSKEEARKMAYAGCIATIKIEWEEKL